MRKKTKRERKPATAEERTALEFERVKARFDWTNEDWALAYLPSVRIASVMLEKDRPELTEAIRGLAADGEIPGLLDRLIEAREHLMLLAKMIDSAINRQFLVLETLGYGPENPPPNSTRDPHLTLQ